MLSADAQNKIPTNTEAILGLLCTWLSGENHKTTWITTALRVTVKIRGQSVNKRFLVLTITQLPRLKPTLVLITFSTVLHPWCYARWMKGLDKLQGCVTPIDSMVTAATTGQNSDQFFSAVWPLTHLVFGLWPLTALNFNRWPLTMHIFTEVYGGMHSDSTRP